MTRKQFLVAIELLGFKRTKIDHYAMNETHDVSQYRDGILNVENYTNPTYKSLELNIFTEGKTYKLIACDIFIISGTHGGQFGTSRTYTKTLSELTNKLGEDPCKPLQDSPT